MATSFLNYFDIIVGFQTSILDLQTQRDGPWIRVLPQEKILIVSLTATGTDGDDPVITLQQATDKSGTSAKALNFTKIFRKQATVIDSRLGFGSEAGTFITEQAAANTYTNTDGHQPHIWVLEIDGDTLDTANGFNHVRLTYNDTGTNAKLGALLHLLFKNKDIFDYVAKENVVADEVLVDEFNDNQAAENLPNELCFTTMAGAYNSVKRNGNTVVKS